MLNFAARCILLADSCLSAIDDCRAEIAQALRGFLEIPGNIVIGVNLSGQIQTRSFGQHLELLNLPGFIIVPEESVQLRRMTSAELAAVLRTELQKNDLDWQCAISIGATTRDLILGEVTRLHFHVGKSQCLSTKIRHVVPLTEQFGTGVANVVTHFAHRSPETPVFQHSDLVDFVERTQNMFAEPNYGTRTLQKAVDVCDLLVTSFADEIAGLFGSGYPFYAFSDFDRPPLAPPPSVMNYFKEQVAYFAAKCIDEEVFVEHVDQMVNADELSARFGLLAGRNAYDTDLFTRMGRLSPPVPHGRQSMASYLAANCFDIASDIWPCQYCSLLQFPEVYPLQRKIKNTNTDCLDCTQTSLMLRNVMGAASDVDIIAVVRDSPEELAERMKQFIIEDERYYLFDLELDRTIVHLDGPIDVFLFALKDIERALQRLTTREWEATTIDTVALWCPTNRFQARLDLCFPISFEPIVLADEGLANQLKFTRSQFAGGEDVDIVIEALRRGSFWSQQLVGNASLANELRKRLTCWRS